MHIAEPRHFLHAPSLPGAGLPSDRMARVAARRAFVELKISCETALAGLSAEQTDWLRRLVRAAEEPSDLWLLRAPMFAALAGAGLDRRARRQTLRRALDSLFPDSESPNSAFASF